MAPTETLAEQHFATIQALLPGEAGAGRAAHRLDAGRRRGDLLGKLATGELSLIVGTHALIEEPVAVRAAGGRGGRRAAPLRRAPAGRARRRRRRRASSPHVLHMTATPIPRTLALARLRRPRLHRAARAPARAPADPDVRLLDRARARPRLRPHPRGAARRPPGVRRLPARRGVRGCSQARAATAEFERLRTGELRDFDVVLLHGQLRPRRQAGGDGGLRRRARPTCSWPPR